MKKELLHFRIASDSMSPVLNVGDEIFWDKVDNVAHDLKRFDLIVFRQGTDLFCHYLWQKNPKRDLYITKPLKNMAREDLPLNSSAILGRVTSHRLNFFWRLKILLSYFLGRF